MADGVISFIGYDGACPAASVGGEPTRAVWTRTGASATFSVSCACGAASSARVRAAAPRVELVEAEFVAWATFVRAARASGCPGCVMAARRWLCAGRAVSPKSYVRPVSG